MEQFGTYIVATTRSQELAHEAEQSRLAKAARTDSEGEQNAPRPRFDTPHDDNLDLVRNASSREREADTSPQPVHSGNESADR